MSKNKRNHVALGAVLVASLLSADGLTAQGMFGDLLEDRVVTLEVTAFDKKGHTAGDLRAEDFEILEDDQAVEITEFKAGGGPLRLVLYFDNIHTQQEGRNHVVDELTQSLVDGADVEVQFMVVTYDGTPRLRQLFTDDATKTRTLLAEIAAEVPKGDELESERKRLLTALEGSKGDCESRLPAVRAHAQEVYDRVERSLSSLETLIRSLSSFDGRKVVVFISDGLALFAGQDAFDLLASECGSSDDSTSRLAQEYDSSKTLIRLAATASTHGTAIVALDAFGPVASDSTSKSRKGAEIGEGPKGMVMKSADGIPMVPVAGLGEASSAEPTPEQLRARNLQSSVAYLANQTGGFTIFNTRSFKSHFESLKPMLMPYYTIGFAPDRSADGRVHTLEARSAKKGIECRFNHSYLDQRAARELGDRLLAYSLYGTNEPNRLGIELEVTVPDSTDSPATARVTVPLSSLVLRPYQGELMAKLAFLTVALNRSGEFTPLHETSIDFAPLPGDSEHLESLPVEILEGEQVLALAVVDVSDGTASFTKKTVLGKSVEP